MKRNKMIYKINKINKQMKHLNKNKQIKKNNNFNKHQIIFHIIIKKLWIFVQVKKKIF